jgi:hypothetical protein
MQPQVTYNRDKLRSEGFPVGMLEFRRKTSQEVLDYISCVHDAFHWWGMGSGQPWASLMETVMCQYTCSAWQARMTQRSWGPWIAGSHWAACPVGTWHSSGHDLCFYRLGWEKGCSSSDRTSICTSVSCCCLVQVSSICLSQVGSRLQLIHTQHQEYANNLRQLW